MYSSQRMICINGDFLPERDAKLSVFDRAVLFADAVYEVSAVVQGKMLDNGAHLARLERSLAALRMPLPLSLTQLADLQRETIARNQLEEGLLYLQISRGVADRDFALPKAATPTFFMFTQAKCLVENPLALRGMKVITLEDMRWKRCDIKTTSLLAASLAKQAALDAGADDAWLTTAGLVKEGTSSNAFIVTTAGQLVTHPLDQGILHGITRAALVRLAREQGLVVEERAFSVAEAHAAQEAFISSAGTFALGVVELDGKAVGDGKPGPLTQRLRALYLEMALEAAL